MIFNRHERIYPGADRATVGALLDSLGQPDDRLWPDNGRWAPMRLDGPLDTFPAGGHGLVRYRVIEHQPGRRVVWQFEDGLGLDGIHRMEVVDGPGLRHTIEARPSGSMRLLWPLVVRWAHDQCLEDLLDQAAVELGRSCKPSRPSPWVRLLLRLGPSPEREEAMLAARDRSRTASRAG